jgi:hypothetical protein
MKTMDARNEWNRARKMIQKFGGARVSSSSVGSALCIAGSTKRKTLREEANGRVNALEANSRDGMKQMLKPVVEVQYTTVMEVVG